MTSGVLRFELIDAGASGSGIASLSDVALVGRKAAGIAIIPPAWRPPYSVLTASTFDEWKLLDFLGRQELIGAAARSISALAIRWLADWPRGIILRSSAVTETLRDRGAYLSVPIPADHDSEQVSKALTEIYSQFMAGVETGGLSVIIQPLVTAGRGYALGHMSNERRVSKTVNQWMWEIDTPYDDTGRFNSWRDPPPKTESALEGSSRRNRSTVLRPLGRWCVNLGRGPAHLEWASTSERTWVLQLDFEDESPDTGVNPWWFLRKADLKDAEPLPEGSPLQKINDQSASTGWRKINSIRAFRDARHDRFPALYWVTGDVLLESIRDHSAS